MSNVRRWYTYVISAISLQAVAWAIIALSRNLIIFGIDPVATAFQISVIIIGLPVFLVHWAWAQSLVGKAIEEREAGLRRFYLYASMASFLGPFIANAFDLVRKLLGGTNDFQSYDYHQLATHDAILYHVTALVVLAVLWFYHQRVVAEDFREVPETGGAATIRRLYVLGFSAAGLTMITQNVIHLIRWLMFQLWGGVIQGGLSVELANEVARLVIGVPLWVVFWIWAQRLFDGKDEEERLSALRKFYLYGAVFVGALCTVSYTTGILAGIIRHLLAVPSSGDIRLPLPIVIGSGILWLYHALVLRDDGKQSGEAPRQAGVHRLYLYLIAGVGLSALLVGLSGCVSVILRAMDSFLGTGLKEELAWFTAAAIAGFPVWIIPWCQVQDAAADITPVGAEVRHSLARRVYLYFFLFVATITVLSSAVYVLFRIISMILGENPPTVTQLGHAIAFFLIAVAVWLYHGITLLIDGKFAKQEKTRLFQALRVVVMDIGEGSFGKAVVDKLMREISGISLNPIILISDTSETKHTDKGQKTVISQLTDASLIIGPWLIAVAGSCEAVNTKIAKVVLSSPARKLLVPFPIEGWDWAGIDRWTSDAIVRHTVRAVKQIIDGDEVKLHRPMSAGGIIGTILGVLFLLILIGVAVAFVIGY